jgi:hypothetical protein
METGEGRTLGRRTNVQRQDRKVNYAQIVRSVDLPTTDNRARVSKWTGV